MPRLLLSLIVLCLPLLPALAAADDGPKKAKRNPGQLSPEAKKIHEEGFVFDGHNDLPWRLRELDDLSFRRIDLRRHQKDMHTDIPRLRKGNVGAQFWSAYVPARTQRKGTAVRETLEQSRFVMAETIEVLHRSWHIDGQSVRPDHRMVAHTGFLSGARLLAG